MSLLVGEWLEPSLVLITPRRLAYFNMRVAVISCYNYRDAWKPFFELFRKFWPDCPYKVDLLTDTLIDEEKPTESVFISKKWDWCDVLKDYVSEWDCDSGQNFMVFQEDMFLNAPVRQDLVTLALEQMAARKAGCVRLYPCPGANAEYGNEHFGIVKRGTPYRVSCQVGIWENNFLYAIASRCGSTPRDFELNGTKIAESLPDEVLAFKRESGEWPLQYLCSAIGAGLWSQDAKKLCDLHGIQVDWSLRGFQPA